jgi:hypothetical protein
MMRVFLVLVAVAGLLAWHALTPNYSPPPGALNPDVTQANIMTTICMRGWTRTVRPPAEYTYRLKVEQMRARHLPGSPRDYEEDHLIPLELGGDPTDPRNLWPESWEEAHIKDGLERRLNGAVCAGRISLQDARREVADPTNWR